MIAGTEGWSTADQRATAALRADSASGVHSRKERAVESLQIGRIGLLISPRDSRRSRITREGLAEQIAPLEATGGALSKQAGKDSVIVHLYVAARAAWHIPGADIAAAVTGLGEWRAALCTAGGAGIVQLPALGTAHLGCHETSDSANESVTPAAPEGTQ